MSRLAVQKFVLGWNRSIWNKQFVSLGKHPGKICPEKNLKEGVLKQSPEIWGIFQKLPEKIKKEWV